MQIPKLKKKEKTSKAQAPEENDSLADSELQGEDESEEDEEQEEKEDSEEEENSDETESKKNSKVTVEHVLMEHEERLRLLELKTGLRTY